MIALLLEVDLKESCSIWKITWPRLKIGAF
jgi:hypothetical protein